MATATDTKCRAVRTGGACQCTNFAPTAGLDRGWSVCAVEGCGHTSAIHNGHKGRANTPVSTPASVPAAKPVSVPKAPSKVTEGTSSGSVPTTAEMRQWLRDNGYNPGARGRLDPAHKVAALAALSK